MIGSKKPPARTGPVAPTWLADTRAHAAIMLAGCVAFATTALAAPCAPPREVHFAAGAAKGDVAGAIARGELDCLTLGARRGQALSAQVDSAEHNAVMQIYAPGWRLAPAEDGGAPNVQGAALHGAGPEDDAAAWSGRLPAKGTYLLVIGSTRGGAEYRLHLKIQ